MSKSYQRLQIEASWRDQALGLALSEEESTALSVPDENEEKLLLRLGILYGVLHRLGIPPHRIEECLSANRKIDIEEAFEWVGYCYLVMFLTVYLTQTRCICIAPKISFIGSKVRDAWPPSHNH
jgi:hypothetical protein